MIKILKYSFYDVLRSRWMIFYFLFFLLTTFTLLYFSSDLSKGIASLTNVIILIIPLISTVFGVMHYYNHREFFDLLLSQPIQRKKVFLGEYLGLSFSLALSFFLGTIIPFSVYGVLFSNDIWNFLILILAGSALTFIFVGLAFLISIINENKIKGFGIAILIWLSLAVIYDGILLIIFIVFNDYPLETPAMLLTLLNPIDLSRVLVMLKLDVSALMGLTGAVFADFFGTTKGIAISFLSLLFWVLMPVNIFLKYSSKKDF